MRIIGGKYKGRRFSPPTNITARPTTDFAKEGIFNVLANHYVNFEGISALDLFSGTGSISMEFASRGCSEVVAVEMSVRQLAYIHKLKESLKVENMHVLRMDVFRYVRTCDRSFDIVWADPPYQMDSLPTLPDLIFECKLLNEGGIFVLEHGANNEFSSHPHFVEHRTYGNVNFSIFR